MYVSVFAKTIFCNEGVLRYFPKFALAFRTFLRERGGATKRGVGTWGKNC